MKIFYTNRAKSDIDIATKWYELQQKNLGIKFLEDVECSVKNIHDFPNMYNIDYQNFRKCILSIFPFSIFYTLEKDFIVIHGVFHQLLDPDKKP